MARKLLTPDLIRRKLWKILSDTRVDEQFLRGWSFPPAMVAISPTLQCNLDCVTCGLKKNLTLPERIPPGTHVQNEMSREQLLHIADELARFRPVIFLSGGEPTLSPHLIPFIRRLNRHRKMFIIMLTNGLRLGDLAADIIDAGITRLEVSIDGTGDTYNSIRGKGRFDEFHRSLTTFFSHKKEPMPFLAANITVAPANQNDLINTVQYAVDMGFSHIQIQHMISITEEFIAENNALEPDPYDHLRWTWGENLRYNDMDVPALKDAIRTCRDIVSRHNHLSISFVPDLDRFGYERYYSEEAIPPDMRQPCKLFYRACVIYPDGSVMPSCACYLHNMGNILETPFRSIWNGENYRRLRTHFNQKRWFKGCEKCTVPYIGCL